MKLLIFIYSLSSGGAERVAVNLANHWAAKGWDITIATLASSNQDFYGPHPSVKRVTLGLASDSANVFEGLWQNLRRVMALRGLLRQLQPDIALSMMGTANIILAMAAWRLSNLRTVGSERTHPPKSSLGVIWEPLRYYAYGRLDTIVALTEETGAWLKANTSARRVRVIPNTASWPLPVQMPVLVPDTVLMPERLLLLAVGRLSAEKNFNGLITVFSELAPKHPNWDLAILGEGSERSALEAQVKTDGLADRLYLPGRAGNMGDWYGRADLYVLSSHFEGFPNTLAEAMAHGLPAVGFDCDTGPRDIIRHGVDGLLVPPEDLPALANALDSLMGDAVLRERFAGKAIEARGRFSLERIAGIWERLFMGLLNGS